jgi:hypothetical protein
LSDTCAFGVLLNATTFFHRHQQEGIGVLHWHNRANDPECLHEQEALVERRLFVLRQSRHLSLSWLIAEIG